MKKKLYLPNWLLSCFVILAFFSSCSDEIEIKGNQENQHTKVTILLRLPKPVVATKGTTGTNPENRIESIRLLLFDRTTQVYLQTINGVLGNTSGTNDNTQTFTANLPATGSYDVVTIANSETNDIDLTGKTKTIAQQKLVTEHTGKWNLSTQAIPMWGEMENFNYTSSSATVQMTRMLARVQVNASATSGTFTLTAVHFRNFNQAGAVMPDPACLNGNQKAIRPSLPENIYKDVDNKLSATVISTGNTCENQLYLFEAAHVADYSSNNDSWKENPTVIIQGRYIGDTQDTYYRMDFINREGKWMDVLRNHTYDFIVHRISGSGYPGLDDAYNAPPVHIEGEVIQWEDNETGGIWVDSQYSLSVNRTYLTVSSRGIDAGEQEKAQSYFKVACNYPEGWTIESIVMEDIRNVFWWVKQTNGTWTKYKKTELENKVFTGDSELFIECGNNNSDEIIEGTFVVCSGRMKIAVTLQQTKGIYIGRFGGDLKNIGGKWSFERRLYVREDDETGSFEWSTESGNFTASHIAWGKKNTYNLVTGAFGSTSFPAAQSCFDSNKTNIDSEDSYYYAWYLPAQNQLMAVWAAQNELVLNTTFDSFIPDGVYWSSTEEHFTESGPSWTVQLESGYTGKYLKQFNGQVRCVREY